jgi:hypothetical protein
MAVLAVQQVAMAGIAPTYAAASVGGDTFANDGHTVLHVKNGGVGSVTVTVDSVTACNQGFDHDSAVVVPAGGERYMGPFPTRRFSNASGVASVAYSGVTSVTVAALKVTP